MEGVCLAYGSKIVGGSRFKTRIHDIAPTVLYLMGEAVPDSMDGVVLEDIVAPEYRKAHEIEYVSADGHPGESPEGRSDEDTEIIKRRLRELGYLY